MAKAKANDEVVVEEVEAVVEAEAKAPESIEEEVAVAPVIPAIQDVIEEAPVEPALSDEEKAELAEKAYRERQLKNQLGR